MCQIWGAGAEAGADSGDLILHGHRSWGPITDIRVILLNPDKEVTILCPVNENISGSNINLHYNKDAVLDPGPSKRTLFYKLYPLDVLDI